MHFYYAATAASTTVFTKTLPSIVCLAALARPTNNAAASPPPLIYCKPAANRRGCASLGGSAWAMVTVVKMGSVDRAAMAS